MSQSQTSDERYTVPALQRGLEVLTRFTRHTPELTGAELARDLDLPRASVFRILQTLEAAGFVERVGDGKHYRLGLGVLRLGFEYLASMELTEHARPLLEALRDDTGYSAHLVVRDGTEVVIVAKSPGRSALFQSIQVGARLPAHATVLGRQLLSGLDMAALSALYPESPLPSYTGKTPVTLAQLKALIDADRANGYGVSQGGFESGISTIAAPVFNDAGGVVAAVSISVPAQQLAPEQEAQLVPQVQQAAARLTQRISHLPARGAAHNLQEPQAA